MNNSLSRSVISNYGKKKEEEYPEEEVQDEQESIQEQLNHSHPEEHDQFQQLIGADRIVKDTEDKNIFTLKYFHEFNQVDVKEVAIRNQQHDHGFLYKEGFMSMLNSRVDIVITYSWGSVPQGICGHVFEAFEAWLSKRLLLHFQPELPPRTIKVLFPQIEPLKVFKAIFDKYSGVYDTVFANKIVRWMITDFVFTNNYQLPKAIMNRAHPKEKWNSKEKANLNYLDFTHLIFVDGRVPPNIMIKCDVLHLQMCGKEWFPYTTLDMDYQTKLKRHLDSVNLTCVYGSEFPDTEFIVDKKRNVTFYQNEKHIPFKFLKSKSLIKMESPKEKRFLLYLTPNCRSISKEFKHDPHNDNCATHHTKDMYLTKLIKEIFFRIKEVSSKKDKIKVKILGIPLTDQDKVQAELLKDYITNDFYSEFKKWQKKDDEILLNLEIEFCGWDKLPITDLFSSFDYYIYTDTPKNFDCSPRLLTEAQFYGKGVILTRTQEKKIKENSGLNRRWELINTPGWEKILDINFPQLSTFNTKVQSLNPNLRKDDLQSYYEKLVNLYILPKSKLVRNPLGFWTKPTKDIGSGEDNERV